MLFLNRTRELSLLDRWWQSNQPELVTLYGRRQIGKTELLVHFLEGKPAIYYYADRQPLADQLNAFSEQVLALVDDPVLRLQPFTSWEAALTYTLRLAEKDRLAIVIDEFSYAVDSDQSLPSVIQRLWDTGRRQGNQAFLVLCTSFTEAVERHFRVDGPLYQRRTRDLRVEPFTYRDAALFFPEWSPVDRIHAWGIVGGVASYLQALHGQTIESAVIDNLLDKTAVLYREAEILLAQEVRGIGPAVLHGILKAVAHGANEPNQIGQRVGRPVTGVSGALGYLVDYGLLEKRVPFTVPNPERTRQSRYYLADNYLAFWFRFVLPNRSALEQGQAAYVWQVKVVPQLTTYMGPRFEQLCRQFIRLTPERWRHPIGKLGVWWRAGAELEIVGHTDGRVVLAAEAKWTNQPVGLDVLRSLQRRVALLPSVVNDCQLVIFSRSGFTAELRAIRDPGLTLFTLDDLLR